MDVMTAIKDRRSIRKYKKKAIPDNVLRDILEAARLAPSSANRQPWEAVVVTDPKLKMDLVPICKHQKWIDECSVFVAAIEDPDQKWSKVDATIMMDHMTLAAHEKGLGTCWIGAFDKDKVGALLGVPPGRTVAVCLTLGYPDENPEARPRKSFDELFHWDKYGVKK